MDSLTDKFGIIDNRGLTLLTPFSVSEERKIIYFHIAKTGGSTIHNILRDSGMDDGILSNKKGNYEEKLEYFRDLESRWDQFFKFTFVRNKYDLLYSLWNYDGKPKGTFKAFICEIVKDNEFQYGLWLDQYYLTVLDEAPIFDFIGRQENFVNDLDYAMQQIGHANYNSKLHLNSAKYDHKVHFSSYYDDASKEIVYNKFKDEIDYYGFMLNESVTT
tara:strand:+ start:4923 stop:5573 length:651 start_codon:yes stop_codon:yes gene_type:complete